MYNSKQTAPNYLLNESFYSERTKEGEFASVKVLGGLHSEVRAEVPREARH